MLTLQEAGVLSTRVHGKGYASFQSLEAVAARGGGHVDVKITGCKTHVSLEVATAAAVEVRRNPC